jgi:hypothetical protein
MFGAACGPLPAQAPGLRVPRHCCTAPTRALRRMSMPFVPPELLMWSELQRQPLNDLEARANGRLIGSPAATPASLGAGRRGVSDRADRLDTVPMKAAPCPTRLIPKNRPAFRLCLRCINPCKGD